MIHLPAADFGYIRDWAFVPFDELAVVQEDGVSWTVGVIGGELCHAPMLKSWQYEQTRQLVEIGAMEGVEP